MGFHPSVQDWFSREFSGPTPVQSQSWPLIADGSHVLITAPTGSGKTLTAFLWSLNQFATGAWSTGHTSVVYISPLKALNNDIQRNLLNPLSALRDLTDYPHINVQTRSGDTSQSERQRMLRRPPEILITTPESLSLLLTTHKGRQALTEVKTVILDEIHSIVDNRRGVQLMTSLERLVDLAGEFQRIALSATVNPLSAVAAYIGGFTAQDRPREVAIVDAPQDKVIDFRVRFPEAARHAAQNGNKIWLPLADSFRDIIAGNRATLFFTNSRRLAEKITLQINDDRIAPIAYAHHGSLARDIRTEVESRLKAGELQAIVATNSLELGIDIGHLDEVVLVQSPPSIASTLQRVGRAGHQVGETSVGTLYPTHAQDFLEAAVLSKAVDERDIEPLTPMTNALDVLAQIIISCCANETWEVEALWRLITRSTPYRNLPRQHFDLVIEMLTGRYSGSRVRELKPQLAFDRVAQTLKANKSALFSLYNSGGTIPDRGYYKLRHADSGAVIGELDEEFVWEARIGQTFTLGTQNWQIQRITHNDVMVRAAQSGARLPPFWRSETLNRSFHFSEKIARYLEQAEAQLDVGADAELQQDLESIRGFEATAAEELTAYLVDQRAATGTALPHRHHLLIEHINAGPGGYRGPNAISQLVLHTFWGGRLNRPWALALEAAWHAQFASALELHADNNAIVIQAAESIEPAALLTLVNSANLHELLRASLEHSGFFGARFRECAGRSLLLTRQRFNQRLPLWMSRLQAKKLMSSVKDYSDFPILLETWRTCLVDEFDLDALRAMLDELHDGQIIWSQVTTSSPSPFAANVTFDQISRYMYADDSPVQAGSSSLSDELIANAIANESLRPKLRRDTIDEFVNKRQRRLAGYEPATDADWLEWLKERIFIPQQELSDRSEIPRDKFATLSSGSRTWYAHPELLHALLDCGLILSDMFDHPCYPVADSRTAEQFAQEFLSFYGPLNTTQIEVLLPSVPAGLLEDDEAFISGQLVLDDATTYYCDLDNFEILLRFQRARSRPTIDARNVIELPGFIAVWQRFGQAKSAASINETLLLLRGLRAPPGIWLQDLFAARFPDFAAHHLDTAVADLQLGWFGCGRESVSLGYPEDADLLSPAGASPLREMFVDPNARYTFFQLADRHDAGLEAFNELWWNSIWAGELIADSLLPLRQGVARNYAFTNVQNPNLQTSRRTSRRTARALSQGWSGNWSLRTPREREADPLTRLEDEKECARLLLDRYGFICRELANREGGELKWSRVFKALRTMELAGEVFAGYFFDGLSGPQFITPAGLNLLQRNDAPPATYWINALDPVSPCGLGLGSDTLPQRRAANYLSYLGHELALITENLGRRLTFLVPPDHASILKVVSVLSYLVRTHKRLHVDTINGEPPSSSPYLNVLTQVLKPVKDHKQIYFELP